MIVLSYQFDFEQIGHCLYNKHVFKFKKTDDAMSECRTLKITHFFKIMIHFRLLCDLCGFLAYFVLVLDIHNTWILKNYQSW